MNHNLYNISYVTDTRDCPLCRIWYEADGSYHVAAPTHPARQAIATKITLNLDRAVERRTSQRTIDLAGTTQQPLELSHLLTGEEYFAARPSLPDLRECEGAREFTIGSFPLYGRLRGSAFVLSISRPELLDEAATSIGNTYAIQGADLHGSDDAEGIVIEGHYLDASWRKLVRKSGDGLPSIQVAHPAGVVAKMTALLSPGGRPADGFLAITVYRERLNPVSVDGPSFRLSGSLSEPRVDLEGHRVVDGIFAMFPEHEVRAQSMREYFMDEVDPVRDIRRPPLTFREMKERDIFRRQFGE